MPSIYELEKLEKLREQYETEKATRSATVAGEGVAKTLQELTKTLHTLYQEVDTCQKNNAIPRQCRKCGFSGDPEALNYKGVCLWCHLNEHEHTQELAHAR